MPQIMIVLIFDANNMTAFRPWGEEFSLVVQLIHKNI